MDNITMIVAVMVVASTLSLLLGFATGRIYERDNHNKDNRALHEEIGMLKSKLGYNTNGSIGSAMRNVGDSINRLFQ